MTWRCAWCEKESPEPERDERVQVTHGICARHLEGLKAEIAERRAKRAVV